MKSVTPSIEAFKALGYHLNIYHYRPVVDADVAALIKNLPQKTAERFIKSKYVGGKQIRDQHLQHRIFPRGGKTMLQLTKENEVINVTSECSIQDIFSKKVGLMKCLYRAQGKVS